MYATGVSKLRGPKQLLYSHHYFDNLTNLHILTGKWALWTLLCSLFHQLSFGKIIFYYDNIDKDTDFPRSQKTDGIHGIDV